LVERLRETLPELPWLRRKRIQQEWGVSDEVMRDLVNAGAVELVAATVEQGASSEGARAWWGNFLVQKANEAGVDLDALLITPAQVAEVVKLVDDGKLSNKLARQVVEGVLAGEGEPAQVMAARGLELVRDDSALQAAVDEALAANPDVVAKIRGGKVQAAGAIVGAVMKATRGQADAAKVRVLLEPFPREAVGIADGEPAQDLGEPEHRVPEQSRVQVGKLWPQGGSGLCELLCLGENRRPGSTQRVAILPGRVVRHGEGQPPPGSRAVATAPTARHRSCRST